jgi:zinc/manganese transport system substrate-binding protein
MQPMQIGYRLSAISYRLSTIPVLAVLLGLLLSACGTAPAAPPSAGSESSTAAKVSVVATHSILGDMTQQVGGELITLRVLVGPGGDAHTFEPTPEDAQALADAKIIFENGLEFEGWIDDLYTASGSSATRAVVSEGITPLELAAGERDPHIWHDVTNAITMVEHIAAGLAKADPTNASTYTANAQRYIAQLKDLDIFIQQEVATLPAERRKLVTSHDTFSYFAKRYGFEVIGSGLGSVSTESADPSPAVLADLVSDIRAAAVPTIFAENVSNPEIMQAIAREAGVTLAPTLYTDALGEPGSTGASYVEMMRFNVTTIVNALRS